MTIPGFPKLHKIFPLLCLTTPLYAQSVDHELRACKSALLSQLNQQKRVDVQGCPVSEKLVYWLGIIRDPHQFTPQELITFLNSSNHWPHYEKLCKSAEEVISTKASSNQILTWFRSHPPQTPEGVIAYGKVLQPQQAEKVVGKAWQTMSLTKAQEKDFLTHFGRLLKPQHHIARLDFLLWEGNVDEAKRMLPRVPANAQQVAQVRIAFLEGKGNASGLTNEGVLYERAKWSRKHKDFDGAYHILAKAAMTSQNAQKWWKEQNYIAREYIALQKYGPAYQIVARHKIQPGSDEFAEAEWFAGWLALRFLGKSDVALAHFKTLSSHVKGAISKSRAAYWIGRAYEQKQQNELAAKAYAKAARYKTTYYGQLAAAKIREKPFPILSKAPQATKEDRSRFYQSELVKAAHILKDLGSGASHELTKFLLHISALAETKAERELSVQLTQALSPHDVVWSAKKAGHQEPVLLKCAYPVCSIPRKGQKVPEVPLVMAVAYQESRFNPSALSSANAMGLLQLIESTASKEAKRIGIAHKKSQLFEPQHNLVLGSAHLSHMLDNFMGSYILTMAAYNAGPTPTHRWVQELGDPRSGKVDVIDWIEMIPYYETRNYVMRVLENVTNYRSALEADPKRTIVDDLKR